MRARRIKRRETRRRRRLRRRVRRRRRGRVRRRSRSRRSWRLWMGREVAIVADRHRYQLRVQRTYPPGLQDTRGMGLEGHVRYAAASLAMRDHRVQSYQSHHQLFRGPRTRLPVNLRALVVRERSLACGANFALYWTHRIRMVSRLMSQRRMNTP